MKWSDITSDERWLGLEEEKKEEMRGVFFDMEVAPQFSPDEIGEARELWDERTSREGDGIFSDVIEHVNVGWNEAALGLREVVGYVSPTVVEWVDKADQWLSGKASTELMEANIDQSFKDMSPRAREAMLKEWWDDDEGELGGAFYDPHAWVGVIAQSAPETAFSMIPSVRVGKMVAGIAMKSGVSATKAAARGAAAAQITGSFVEGAMSGGAASKELRKYVMDVDQDTLNGSEAYQALKDTGLTDEQARETLASNVALQALVTVGPIAMAFGGQGDRILSKGMLGVLKGNMAARIAKGAASEMVEEIPQGGLGRIAQNIAKQEVDPTIETTEGAIGEAIAGAAAGGVMGAGFGSITKAETPEGTPIPPPPGEGGPIPPPAQAQPPGQAQAQPPAESAPIAPPQEAQANAEQIVSGIKMEADATPSNVPPPTTGIMTGELPRTTENVISEVGNAATVEEATAAALGVVDVLKQVAEQKQKAVEVEQAHAGLAAAKQAPDSDLARLASKVNIAGARETLGQRVQAAKQAREEAVEQERERKIEARAQKRADNKALREQKRITAEARETSAVPVVGGASLQQAVSAAVQRQGEQPESQMAIAFKEAQERAKAIKAQEPEQAAGLFVPVETPKTVPVDPAVPTQAPVEQQQMPDAAPIQEALQPEQMSVAELPEKLTTEAATKALSKNVMADGKMISRKALVEKAIDQGKDVNTRKAGKRTVYLVGGRDLGKTAYDYASFLKTKEKVDANKTRERQVRSQEKSSKQKEVQPENKEAGQAVVQPKPIEKVASKKSPIKEGDTIKDVRKQETTDEKPAKTEKKAETQERKAATGDTRSVNSLFSFLGIRSKTADVSAMNRAATMRKAGMSREVIREQTGWFLWADGMWRYELSDADMKLVPNAEDGKLGTMIEHPRLFAAYPELKDINVETMPGSDSRGSFTPLTQTIRVSKSRRREVLAHEIQHIIQSIEGFAKGGSVKAFTDDPLVHDYIDLDHAIKVAKERAATNARGSSLIFHPLAPKVDRKLKRMTVEEIEAFEKTLPKLLTRYDKYLKLAGEIEARDVAHRVDLTAMERHGEVPYESQGIPEEDALVVFKEGDIARAQPESYVPMVRAELVNELGEAKVARLLKSGLLVIEETAPPWVEVDVAGEFDGAVMHLYADTITEEGEGIAAGVLLHEGEHAGMRSMLGDSYDAIQKQFDALVDSNDPTAQAALARIPGDTRPEAIPNERLAYFIQEAHGREKLSGQARLLKARIWNAIRAWFRQTAFGRELAKVGIDWQLSDGYILALAKQALTHIEGAGQPPGSMYSVLGPFGQRRVSSAANDRIRGKDAKGNRRLRVKAKHKAKRWLATGGNLPKVAFNLGREKDTKKNIVEMDIKNLVAHLEDAVKAAYGRRFGDLKEQELRNLHHSLTGQRVASNLDPRVQDAINGMRDYIDNFSKEYGAVLHQQAAQMQAEGKVEHAAQRVKLMNIIESHIGEYVHRSYQVHGNSKWIDQVPDDVVDTARVYITDKRETEALKLDDWAIKADARGEANKAAKHRTRAAELRDPDRIDKTINLYLTEGTAFDSMESFIMGGKLGAMDLSILMKRGDIAPEIRALLGEYIDPRLNFANTATKMGGLIHNQNFLNKLLEEGEGNFLFRTAEAAPFDVTKVIATGNAYSPIDGMFTSPEIEEAFRDAIGLESMDGMYGWMVRQNGKIKYGKTVLSPPTAIRNAMAGFFFAMASSHFDMTHMVKTFRTWHEYANGKDEGKLFAYLKEMVELDVIFDTPYAGELKRMLKDSKIDDFVAKKGWSRLQYAMRMAEKFYQFGDDFWKIVGFENEKALLIKHLGMSESEAKVKAAERIRATYPTYSMTPKLVTWLSRNIFAGTFVSFPAEIIRTTYNLLTLTGKELMDPRTRSLGRRRLLGLAIVGGAAHALQMLSMLIHGVDDEEQEALRDLGMPWSANSNLIATGRDKDGLLQYLDASFIDPYNYFKRPINAMLRDEPWEDKFKAVAKELLGPFFGEDIAAGAIMDAYNRLNPEDRVDVQIIQVLGDVIQKIQPGGTAVLQRMMWAMDGKVSTSGKKYNMKDEVLAAGGFRFTTFDPKTSLYYKSGNLRYARANSSRILSKVAQDPNEVSDDQLEDAFNRADKARRRSYKELIRNVVAAERAGMERHDIYQALRDSFISKRDVAAIMKGNIPRWNITNRYMSGAIKKANVLFTPATKAEFIKRRNKIKKLAAGQVLE